MTSSLPTLWAAFVGVLAAGGAASGAQAIEPVPAAIQVPAGAAAYLEVLANGVQIYECSLRPDSTYQWALKAPRATLSDTSGKAFGKHYAGPTWEAADRSLAVGEAKAGKVEYRTDKQAIVHLSIGKTSFEEQGLLDNYAAVIEEIVRAKPAAAKGRYLQTITLATTMGPGVRVDPTRVRESEILADVGSGNDAEADASEAEPAAEAEPATA